MVNATVRMAATAIFSYFFTILYKLEARNSEGKLQIFKSKIDIGVDIERESSLGCFLFNFFYFLIFFFYLNTSLSSIAMQFLQILLHSTMDSSS